MHTISNRKLNKDKITNKNMELKNTRFPSEAFKEIAQQCRKGSLRKEIQRGERFHEGASQHKRVKSGAVF